MSQCACGTKIPEDCGRHPEGDHCMCYGSMCAVCLAEALLGDPANPAS